MNTPGLSVATGVPLASYTTLELGGAAEHFVRADQPALLLDALRWARARALPVHVLGGGSNLVVSDRGVRGLCIRIETRGVEVTVAGDKVRVRVAAGEDWDALVARTVDEGWAGLECLSGIPGRAGATPIQNVGAYGQEVAQTIHSVELIERDSLLLSTWDAAACGFGYRTSAFKAGPDRFVVVAVTFELDPRGRPAPRYPELIKALGGPRAEPSLREVRDATLALRRAKSMVIDARDDNRRSAGSFFLNPVLAPDAHRALVERALEASLVARAEDLPGFAAEGGVKLPAAWLIERAGFQRGQREGNVGISSRHALALVHHGGGTSAELLAFAARIQARVHALFGVQLHPEPVLWGFSDATL